VPKKYKKKNKPLTLFWRNGFFSRLFGVLTLLLMVFFAMLIFLSERTETFTPILRDEQAFVEQISGYAQTLHKEYGVLPSISISQAILESNWGESGLTQTNNNLYGIKGGSDETLFATKEFYEDEWVEIDASFRNYDSWHGSMEDHARLLAYGTAWDANHYAEVIEAENYEEAAYALQHAGYATDPGYAEKLIHLIEQYRLYEYD